MKEFMNKCNTKDHMNKCNTKDHMNAPCQKVKHHDYDPNVPAAMHKGILSDGRGYSWVSCNIKLECGGLCKLSGDHKGSCQCACTIIIDEI
jgi:hypothetical protein